MLIALEIGKSKRMYKLLQRYFIYFGYFDLFDLWDVCLTKA